MASVAAEDIMYYFMRNYYCVFVVSSGVVGEKGAGGKLVVFFCDI